MRYPNINAERVRLGLSYEDLASQLGVNRKTVYNWIRVGNIPQSALIKMSDLFNSPIDYLLSTSPICMGKSFADGSKDSATDERR